MRKLLVVKVIYFAAALHDQLASWSCSAAAKYITLIILLFTHKDLCMNFVPSLNNDSE